MIEPFASDDIFLASVDAARAADDDALRVWWLGQSGFLVANGGSLLLLDPYLSDSLTTKYAGTKRPHVRMTRRVVDPARLSGVAVVTSSHNHTDHLDGETLRAVFAASPGVQFVIPEANREFASTRTGCDLGWPIGLDDGASTVVAGWRLTGVAAAHNELTRDEAGRHVFLGYVIQRGPWTLYHSGDTLAYGGLVEKLTEFAVDVAFLPINGNRPERGVAGNMDGVEAARVARDIGVRWAVPHHYEMFEFNTAEPDELFVPECGRIGQRSRVLRAGEEWVVPREA